MAEEGLVEGAEAWTAATAACRSFLRRLSSSPRLELSGRRVEEGERLDGRLLCDTPPPTPPEDECFLPREREPVRRDKAVEKATGERLRDRAERLGTGLALDERRLPYGLMEERLLE